MSATRSIVQRVSPRTFTRTSTVFSAARSNVRTVQTAAKSRQSASITPTQRPYTVCARQIASGKHLKLTAQSRKYATASAVALKRTALYDLHVRQGGKMVEFGGWEMPVQYSSQSIGESHRWVREKCGLFDVSHMVQHQFTGPGALTFLESLCPSDLKALPEYTSTLSVLLHPDGGIIDDLIITKHSDSAFYVVTNAGNAEKDTAHITKHLASFPDVQHAIMDRHSLIALQGPLAKDVLVQHLPKDAELEKLLFGQSMFSSIGGVMVHVARGGYTGEDGFEISIPSADVAAITDLLLQQHPEEVRMIGLGARDSLRLEAGMCLYGHDLDDTTTPVEGALSWLIPKSRRETGGFPGAEKILDQIKNGVQRRRVGFIVENAVAREGALIVDVATGEQVGVVTSGCPAPTLGSNVGMGYIKQGYHKSGTEIGLMIRNKMRKGTVSKMPFIKTKYWKGIAPA